jgi:hypothetical protein
VSGPPQAAFQANGGTHMKLPFVETVNHRKLNIELQNFEGCIRYYRISIAIKLSVPLDSGLADT